MAVFISLSVFIVSLLALIGDKLFFARKRFKKSKLVYGLELALVFSLIVFMVEWYNFEFALTMVVLISGIIYLLDFLWFSKSRAKRFAKISEQKADSLAEEERAYLTEQPTLIELSKSFFGVLLLVLVIRTCLFSPFRIPSGSLKPTLLVGDFILVNKYEYGLRLPVIGKTIIPIRKPQRGDIVVVRWPPNERLDFIKRLIGLPGDTIKYIDKTLYINGEKAEQIWQRDVDYAVGRRGSVTAKQYVEDLDGFKHGIYTIESRPSADYDEIKVPKGKYFIMGDNRDDSEDSRYWGFVDEDQLLGKAEYIVFSWDSPNGSFRKERFIKKIY